MQHRHPIVAAIYDRFLDSCERSLLGGVRADLLRLADGMVIEVGAGTGRNFPHYPAATVRKVAAVEPDPYMRRRAEPRARAAPVTIRLVDAMAESLPFPAGCADTVVNTFVLCSVDAPQRAIAEIRRVLKPGGALLFAEHIRSDERWRARLQTWVEPIWRRIAANCHPNRRTLALLEDGGFEVQETRRLAFGEPWTQPVVVGVAHIPQNEFQTFSTMTSSPVRAAR